jgi:hypothetical protein
MVKSGGVYRPGGKSGTGGAGSLQSSSGTIEVRRLEGLWHAVRCHARALGENEPTIHRPLKPRIRNSLSPGAHPFFLTMATMTSSRSTKLRTMLWRHVSTCSWACWETSGERSMPSGCALSAQNIKRSGSDGGHPEIGDHAWNHIHLGHPSVPVLRGSSERTTAPLRPESQFLRLAPGVFNAAGAA